MEQVLKNAGMIHNVFTTEDMDKIKKMLLKLTKTYGYDVYDGTNGYEMIKGNEKPIQEHYGTDNKSIVYPLILKMFRNKLEHMFGKFEIVFVSYSNATKPVGLHRDHHFHAEHNLPGKHYFSFIVPYSVDDKIEKCNMASTVVFDDYEKYDRNDNAIEHYTSYLKHISESDLATVKVKRNNIWKHGSLIWWDSKLFHASGYFEGVENKQCLVGHTYML